MKYADAELFNVEKIVPSGKKFFFLIFFKIEASLKRFLIPKLFL